MDPAIIKKSNNRILQEIKKLQESDTCKLVIPTIDGIENINLIYVMFITPTGTYAGHTHIVEVKFHWGNPINSYYPYNPPLMTFKTPIWHPNISAFPGGAICLDFLKQSGKWVPTCSVEGLLYTIMAMLEDPNPDSPQNSVAGNAYKSLIKDPGAWTLECSKYYKEHIGSCKDIIALFDGIVSHHTPVEYHQKSVELPQVHDPPKSNPDESSKSRESQESQSSDSESSELSESSESDNQPEFVIKKVKSLKLVNNDRSKSVNNDKLKEKQIRVSSESSKNKDVTSKKSQKVEKIKESKEPKKDKSKKEEKPKKESLLKNLKKDKSEKTEKPKKEDKSEKTEKSKKTEKWDISKVKEEKKSKK